jgi:hypothetical protein
MNNQAQVCFEMFCFSSDECKRAKVRGARKSSIYSKEAVSKATDQYNQQKNLTLIFLIILFSMEIAYYVSN